MRSVELYPRRDKVIDFIKWKHGDQKRMHGGPYFLHPIAVTDILYDEFGVKDRETLMIGDCHDLLEDTQTTHAELTGVCGEAVANGVQLLTKVKPQLESKADKERWTIKYYLSLREAPHNVLSVKVADRIHNLREMQFANVDFQRRYLLDTTYLISALSGYADHSHMAYLQREHWLASERYINVIVG